MDGASAAVAVVGEVVRASVGWGGLETSLFATAGSLEFVIAAHLEYLSLKTLGLIRWCCGRVKCSIEKDMFMYERACSTYLALLSFR